MENKQELYIEIPKKRAEVPALVVMGFVVFAGWALHYGIFNIVGGLLWLSVALPVYFWIYKKRTGKYFVQVNEEGIGFRQHFFQIMYIFHGTICSASIIWFLKLIS